MKAASHPMFEHRWPDGEFRLFQLGFVVPNLMSAASRWVQVFGVGPFHIMPRVQNSCRYRGADASVDIEIGVAQAGPVQIELIQDNSRGNSVFAEMAARVRLLHRDRRRKAQFPNQSRRDRTHL